MDTPELRGQNFDVTVADSISATDDYDFAGAVIKIGVYETASLRTALSATALLHNYITESFAGNDQFKATSKTGNHIIEYTSTVDVYAARTISHVIEFTTESDSYSARATHTGRMVEVLSGIEAYSSSSVFHASIIESTSTIDTISVKNDIEDVINIQDTFSLTQFCPPVEPPSIPSDVWVKKYAPPILPYQTTPVHALEIAQDKKRILQYTYRIKPGQFTGR